MPVDITYLEACDRYVKATNKAQKLRNQIRENGSALVSARNCDHKHLKANLEKQTNKLFEELRQAENEILAQATIKRR